METSLDCYFNRTEAESISSGCLSVEISIYAERLYESGYKVQTARLQLRMLNHFQRWLEQRHISIERIDASVVERYLASRYRKFKRRCGDAAVMRRLLELLPVEPPPYEPSQQQTILGLFRDYLLQQRGLSMASVTNYTPIVRQFLAHRFPSGDIQLADVSARDITGFVQQQAEQIHSKRAPLVVTALRAFLKHSLQRGAIQNDLAACVPTIATWSLSTIPRYLPQDQIQKVIDSCDRSTAAGRRDYAIVLLMSRLGLRGGEVVALALDDVDWDAGVITVRGKGKRVTQLPLPTEVGKAIVEYLRNGRPCCDSRHVFIRQKAPLRQFANTVAVCSLVDRALRRANVESPHRGGHVFRHSLATHMVNQGATLPEIGDLLRHRRPDTTTIYAKVDLRSLRTIALPWPGGDR